VSKFRLEMRKILPNRSIMSFTVFLTALNIKLINLMTGIT